MRYARSWLQIPCPLYMHLHTSGTWLKFSVTQHSIFNRGYALQPLLVCILLSTTSYQEDYIITVSAEQDNLPCSNEIKSRPPKKINNDQDEKIKHQWMTSISSFFLIHTHFLRTITVSLNNKPMPPDPLEKFITAVARQSLPWNAIQLRRNWNE